MLLSILPGLIMVLGGIIYMIKPNLIRRNPQTKNFISGRVMSDAEYAKYMRRMGAIVTVVGALWTLYELNKQGKL